MVWLIYVGRRTGVKQKRKKIAGLSAVGARLLVPRQNLRTPCPRCCAAPTWIPAGAPRFHLLVQRDCSGGEAEPRGPCVPRQSPGTRSAPRRSGVARCAYLLFAARSRSRCTRATSHM